MDSISKNTKEFGDLIRSVDRLPLPRSIEDIVNLTSKIINKGLVQSILLDIEEGVVVDWYRTPNDSLNIVEPDESLTFVLSRINIDELEEDNILKAMLVAINNICLEGYVPSVIVTSNIKALTREFPNFSTEYDSVYKCKKLFGLFIKEESTILDSYFLVCGSSISSFENNQIMIGYKINIGEN